MSNRLVSSMVFRRYAGQKPLSRNFFHFFLRNHNHEARFFLLTYRPIVSWSISGGAYEATELLGRFLTTLSRRDHGCRRSQERHNSENRHCKKELIFCFGEVDVRLHIKYKHLQLGTPIEQLIARTAERYTSHVKRLRNDGYRIHVFNVVPTGDFLGPAAEKWQQGLSYPFNATYEERSNYTEQLNNAYARCCDELQIPFVDIYQYLVDNTGKRRQDLAFDFAHINNSCADLVLEHHVFPALAAE